MKLIILISTLLLSSSSAQNVIQEEVESKDVKCLVCRTVIDEFLDNVAKIDPNRKQDIGYRIDARGNTFSKQIPLASSEIHLSELLEKECEAITDYARAKYKSNGKLVLMKLVVDGQLNPLMNQVDLIQDGDMNKSLENYCKDLISEYEEEIIQGIIEKQKNLKNEICTQVAEYCPKGFDDDDDDTEYLDKDEEEAQESEEDQKIEL